MNALAALLFILLLVSLAAWLYGRFANLSASASPPAKRRTFSLISLALLLLAVFLGYDNSSDSVSSAPGQVNTNTYGGLMVIAYSEEALAEARQQNKPIYVDFTAAWCLTCQTNKKLVFDSDKVLQAFNDREVIILVGDCTRYDPSITDAISKLESSGVPVNVLYPSQPTEDPVILPKVLTSAIVLDALDSLK